MARARLEERLLDYEDFLRHRHLGQGAPDSPEAQAVRQVGRLPADHPTDPSDQTDTHRQTLYAKGLEHENLDRRANALICLIHQAHYLLDQQIATLEARFVEGGGYSEPLATARLTERTPQNRFHRIRSPPVFPPAQPVGSSWFYAPRKKERRQLRNSGAVPATPTVKA